MKEEWCLPTVSPEFVWRMEDVLELYAEPYDPAYPVVCFDESPYQMISETRVPVPVEQGKPPWQGRSQNWQGREAEV